MSAERLDAVDEVQSVVAGPRYPIESVDNVLRLLLMVSQQKQVRVSEASAALGTAVSTAHRLLAMLAHHGFVVQDPESKAYRAGHVLLRIGLATVGNFEIRTLIHPFLEELRDETRETVHSAVLQASEVMFIDCAESPQALRVASRVGTLMWAHCTSVGKAWLACESDDFLRGLYPSPRLPALTPDSITSRAALLTELADVRRRGFAHNEGESEVGVGSVSAAVCDRHGRPVAGISVSAPLARMDDERRAVLAEAVQRTCRGAAATLPLVGAAAPHDRTPGGLSARLVEKCRDRNGHCCARILDAQAAPQVVPCAPGRRRI